MMIDPTKRACRRLTRIFLTFLGGLALALPGTAFAEDALLFDLFSGMVVQEGGQIFLDRCDLGRTRYRLENAPGAGDALASLRGRTGDIKVGLMAAYREETGGHVLQVSSVDEAPDNRSCHLIDALDQLEAEAATAEAAGEPEHTWLALAEGAAAPASAPTIGEGAFAYRFVLRSPRTGKPARHTDFALTTSRQSDYVLPFVKDEKKVFQGRTDGKGRTPVFRLQVRLPDSAWDLRERFGSGPYGETFHLTDHLGNDLFNQPYLLMLCTKPPRYFRGYTYANGDTAYTASKGPEKIELYVEDEDGGPRPRACGLANDPESGEGE